MKAETWLKAPWRRPGGIERREIREILMRSKTRGICNGLGVAQIDVEAVRWYR